MHILFKQALIAMAWPAGHGAGHGVSTYHCKFNIDFFFFSIELFKSKRRNEFLKNKTIQMWLLSRVSVVDMHFKYFCHPHLHDVVVTYIVICFRVVNRYWSIYV